ncbi:transcriptional regulator, TetR family [Chitinophaga costaii]|uniref:Transcriptional regulator, TetR family n=1 Tax=Chitinophaga costaii TaxID=1335309 RepID=A0A1C4F2W8_9BACT|nr:TetR/AcrR family transcriptional regulator [Chitinophaga costaii]PUZ22126.1 TetR/AcrR family transcriptional regulator [Chitinophaga costaii]SCC50023.1 transcriptional regulator, TetR family [Chitinophaga costaii]
MKPLDPSKRVRIINAVYRIVGKNGLAGVNIKSISTESGLATGSIYTYFSNKEDIIQASYLHSEHSMSAQIYQGLDIRDPVKRSLYAIYFNTLKYRLKHYNEIVFADQYLQSNYVQLNLEKAFKDYEEQHAPLYEVFRKGQQEGLFVNQSLFLMSNFFMGAVRSASIGMLQNVLKVSRENVESSFTMAWKGICL